MKRFERLRNRLKPGKKRFVMGVHPVPTMVTLGNLVCGFCSIMLAFKAGSLASQPAVAGEYNAEDLLYFAALLIFGGMIFDVLDGSVARLTKSTSKFGMEMDSLCDVVTFGVAPAVLVKTLIDMHIGRGQPYPMLDRYIIPLLVIYVSCAALRLARYNVESSAGHSSFFFGMPSPGAAGCAASLVLMVLPATHHWAISPLKNQVNQIEPYVENVGHWVLISFPIIMLGLGILMVSRVHYQHIGDKILKGKKSFMHLLVLFVVLALLVMHHEIMLAVAFNGYMLFGLINELRFQLFPKNRPAEWNVPASGEPATQPPVPGAPTTEKAPSDKEPS